MKSNFEKEVYYYVCVNTVVTNIRRVAETLNNDISVVGNLIQIINQSRQNALKKVNEELINMYWKVGQYLSAESKRASFGDAYIDSISKEIQEAFPGIKGFTI